MLLLQEKILYWLLAFKYSIFDLSLLLFELFSDTVFLFLDFCENNCDDEISDETIFAYLIYISYSGYKIDHQNTDTPLERNNDKYTFHQEFYFSTESSSLFQVFWNVITYKEEKGLLGLFDNFD